MPVRLREVVYTVSPFEVTILNGLVKDFPGKVMRHLTEVGLCARAAAQVPLPLHVAAHFCGRILTLPPAALQKGPNIAFWCVGPIAAIVWCDLPPTVLTFSTCDLPKTARKPGTHIWSQWRLLDLQVRGGLQGEGEDRAPVLNGRRGHMGR